MIRGPDLEMLYGYPYPVRLRGDASIDWTTDGDHTLTFIIGEPGPVDDVVAAPLVSQALSVTGQRTAGGTLAWPDPPLAVGSDYGYVVVDETAGGIPVCWGRVTVRKAPGAA